MTEADGVLSQQFRWPYKDMRLLHFYDLHATQLYLAALYLTVDLAEDKSFIVASGHPGGRLVQLPA